MSIKPFLFICLCSVFITIANGTCYWIDGTIAPDRVACNDLSKVGVSMCCAEESSQFFDSCTDGICAYTYASGVQGQYDNGLSFWRDSCTDPTWQNPACVNIASNVRSSQVRLSKCADGSFCARNTDDPNTICCENHQGEFAKNTNATLSANSAITTTNSQVSTSKSLSHSSSASIAADSGLASTSLSNSSPASSTGNPTSKSLSHSSSASIAADSGLASTSLSNSSPASSTGNLGVATPTSSSQSSQDNGNGLNRASEIAAIAGSVVGALALIAALVFGINSWRQRHSPVQSSGPNINVSQKAPGF